MTCTAPAPCPRTVAAGGSRVGGVPGLRAQAEATESVRARSRAATLPAPVGFPPRSLELLPQSRAQELGPTAQRAPPRPCVYVCVWPRVCASTHSDVTTQQVKAGLRGTRSTPPGSPREPACVETPCGDPADLRRERQPFQPESRFRMSTQSRRLLTLVTVASPPSGLTGPPSWSGHCSDLQTRGWSFGDLANQARWGTVAFGNVASLT